MKRVLKIFVHDLVGLSRNIFALIIAVGLCIIPSLYAWFNIYSNWDPYANTSSIKVAVVSQDAGYKNSDGKNVNMGEEVLDTLRKNKGLGWQILGTYDDGSDSRQQLFFKKYDLKSYRLLRSFFISLFNIFQ